MADLRNVRYLKVGKLTPEQKLELNIDSTIGDSETIAIESYNPEHNTKVVVVSDIIKYIITGKN